MATVVESLREVATELERCINELVTDHSEVYRVRADEGPGAMLVFFTSGDYGWRPLANEGARLQAHILERYGRFSAVVRTLLREHPTATLTDFDSREKSVLSTVLQEDGLYSPGKDKPLRDALDALREQTLMLERLLGGSDEHVFVPDTNALLWHPELDAWTFADVRRFTLVLVPGVVRELDEHKVHRNASVRAKANRIARQIGEYRRRGRLTDGVPLRSSVSTIKMIAVEPRIDRSLPWLDPSSQDDRILASTIEVMRLYARSNVSLVTRDVNLHNKAEYALVPAVAPPTPPAPAKRKR
jgi:hypothetical protein